MIQIVDQKIDEDAVLQSVKSPNAGACLLFVGTTRRITDEKVTLSLHYDAYVEMALKELQRLASSAQEKWPLLHCSIVHRTGEVPVGQSSVAVAVSSPHRVAAFEAASWIMDTLKKDVPIWKKEVWADGSQQWIHPTPDASASPTEPTAP